MTVCHWFRAKRGVLTAALILATRLAAAEAKAPPTGRVEPFRLIWSSTAGCGNPSSFLSELERRTTLLRPARPNEHAITLIVETFRLDGEVKGQLTVRKPDGALSERELPGGSCHEVESAMALIAALTVDPLAGSDPRRTTTRTAPAPTQLADRPGSLTPRGTDALEETTPPADWSLRVEHHLTAHTALAPELTWGQALAVLLTLEAGRIAPSVGLAAHRAKATVSSSQGSAVLEWAAGELTACPLGVSPGEDWDLRACAALLVGRLKGRGYEVARPATKSVLWSSAALQLEARYRLVGPLWALGQAALSLPFSRESFYLAPETPLHELPATGLSLGAGLGLRFF